MHHSCGTETHVDRYQQLKNKRDCEMFHRVCQLLCTIAANALFILEYLQEQELEQEEKQGNGWTGLLGNNHLLCESLSIRAVSGERVDMLICLSSLTCLRLLLKSSLHSETPSFSFPPLQHNPQTVMAPGVRGFSFFPKTLGKRHRETLGMWFPGPERCQLQEWMFRVMSEVCQHWDLDAKRLRSPCER